MKDDKECAQKVQVKPDVWKADTSQVKSIEETYNIIEAIKKSKRK